MVLFPGQPKRILLFQTPQPIDDQLKSLLKSEGYRVSASYDEDEAVDLARHLSPDLIVVYALGTPTEILRAARHVRLKSQLHFAIPIVIISSQIVPEGEEWEIDGNIYLIAPETNTQLRMLIRRVVRAT
jgi:PleD family two-component response regulator